MAETRAIEVVGDYPHNVIDFDRRFDSEEACTAYLVSLRWPQGFFALRVADAERGDEHDWRCFARVAATRPRSSLGHCSRRPTNRCKFGSRRCGGSRARKRAPVLSDSNESWGWAVTRRHGCGFTNFVPQWFDRGVIVLRAVSRSMKPTLAALRRASKAEKHTRNRSWRSPSRCTRQRGSDGCACIASEIVRRGTSCRSCKERWSQGQS